MDKESISRIEGIVDMGLPVLLGFSGGLIMFADGYRGYDINWHSPIQIIGAATAVAGGVIFVIRFGMMIYRNLSKKKTP